MLFWLCQLGSSSSSRSGLTAEMLGPAAEYLLGASRQDGLQERPETDPADPQWSEGCRVILIRQSNRVDRQRQLGCQAAQRGRIVPTDRIQRIGAGLGGLHQPR